MSERSMKRPVGVRVRSMAQKGRRFGRLWRGRTSSGVRVLKRRELHTVRLASSPTVFRTPSDRLGHSTPRVRDHNTRQVVKTLNESAVSNFSPRSARGLHRRTAVRWGDWMDGPLIR
jgi:hypothetical protein